MIRINLLPEEYRRKARTPLKVLGLLCAVAGANALLFVWYAWLAFGVAAEIEGERTVLQTELDGLKLQVNYHQALDGERKRFSGREATLAGITKTRINWTEKLDELIRLINNGGEGQRHFVWLDDLQVTQNADPRAKSAGQLKAAGHSGSEDFGQVANFLDDLEDPSFMEDFLPPSAPEGTQTQIDEELQPPVVWNFPVLLQLKSKEPPKTEAAAKPATPPAPAAQEQKP